MNKARTIYTVDFSIDSSSPSIEVELMKGNNTISLTHYNIAYCSKLLSQKEIETVIEILETKKELMLKECDFPSVYSEMLDELITAHDERYGVKDTYIEKQYRLSRYGLEWLLRQHFDLEEVHIDSVIGGVNHICNQIDLKDDDGAFFVAYRGWRRR